MQETEGNPANKIIWIESTAVLSPMRKNCWPPAIAIGITLATATLAYGVGRDGGHGPAREQSAAVTTENILPPDELARDNAIQRIAQTLETQTTDAQSPVEQSRAERSVTAAEKVADWTPKLFGTALLEMLITGLGVLLVARTLIYTREAATAARDAVIEARSATAIAQQQLVEAEKMRFNEHRPWLRITVVPLNGIQWTKDLRTHFDFDIKIENFGRSPAVQVEVKPKLISFSYEFNDPAEALRSISDEMISEGSLPNCLDVFPSDVEQMPCRNWDIDGVEAVLKYQGGSLNFGTALIGCVQYQAPGSPQILQTSFMYAVEHKLGDTRVAVQRGVDVSWENLEFRRTGAPSSILK